MAVLRQLGLNCELPLAPNTDERDHEFFVCAVSLANQKWIGQFRCASICILLSPSGEAVDLHCRRPDDPKDDCDPRVLNSGQTG
jgi:hypothetical protein